MRREIYDDICNILEHISHLFFISGLGDGNRWLIINTYIIISQTCIF